MAARSVHDALKCWIKGVRTGAKCWLRSSGGGGKCWRGASRSRRAILPAISCAGKFICRQLRGLDRFMNRESRTILQSAGGRGVRFQVSGVRCQWTGVRDQGSVVSGQWGRRGWRVRRGFEGIRRRRELEWAAGNAGLRGRGWMRGRFGGTVSICLPTPVPIWPPGPRRATGSEVGRNGVLSIACFIVPKEDFTLFDPYRLCRT